MYYCFKYFECVSFLLAPVDLETAKKENQRIFSLIPEISIAQRELAAMLGDVRLGYELRSELEETIETLHKFRTIEFEEPDQEKINTEK